MSADLKTELSSLQSRLEARRSTLHFAHAAVSCVVALILAGGVARIAWVWDEDHLVAAIPMTVVSVTLLLYCAVRWVLGRKALKGELVDFAQLTRLRTELRLDDPAALLPR